MRMSDRGLTGGHWDRSEPTATLNATEVVATLRFFEHRDATAEARARDRQRTAGKMPSSSQRPTRDLEGLHGNLQDIVNAVLDKDESMLPLLRRMGGPSGKLIKGMLASAVQVDPYVSRALHSDPQVKRYVMAAAGDTREVRKALEGGDPEALRLLELAVEADKEEPGLGRTLSPTGGTFWWQFLVTALAAIAAVAGAKLWPLMRRRLRARRRENERRARAARQRAEREQVERLRRRAWSIYDQRESEQPEQARQRREAAGQGRRGRRQRERERRARREEAAAIEAEAADVREEAAAIEAEAANVREEAAAIEAEAASVQTVERGGQEAAFSALQAQACVVCMDGPKTHALFPCGHKCLCQGCSRLYGTNGAGARQHHQRQQHTCPMCRSPVERVQQIYD